MESVAEFFAPARRLSIDSRRQQQRGEWFDSVLAGEVLQQLLSRSPLRSACEYAREQCIRGQVAPSLSVHRLLGRIHLTITEDV
jgi:hypothetical protein